MGCFWSLVGCVLGGIWGGSAAWLVGLINAPVVNRSEYEWYTVFILLILVPGGLMIGALIGLFAVDAFKAVGGKALAWGFAGWVLALAVGNLVFTGRPEPFFLILHGLLTYASTGCGLYLSVLSRVGKTHQRTNELRE